MWRRRNLLTVSFYLMVSVFILFTGCSGNFIYELFQPDQPEPQDNVLHSDIGDVEILEVAPNMLTLLNNLLTDSLVHAEKYIEADVGGTVKAGNKHFGECKIKFRGGDLPQDTTITMDWKISEGIYEVELKPNGIIFNQPVRLEMSFLIAKLDDVNLNSLHLFYFNEQKNIWEYQGGEVNGLLKKITYDVSHFSRFALAHGQ